VFCDTDPKAVGVHGFELPPMIADANESRSRGLIETRSRVRRTVIVLAGLMALGGAMVLLLSDTVATASSRPEKTAGVAAQASAAGPAVSPAAPAPGQRGALRSSQYYDPYTTYTEQAIRIFSSVGVHVFLVGTPIDQSSVAGWDRRDNIYRRLAQANAVATTYVDAGAAVEAAGGRFTWRLPCMNIEPNCGPNGTNIVRSPDGIHSCPDGVPAPAGVTGPCDEYSPGGFRFALAIVSAITVDLDHAPATVLGFEQ
jgi:hypothetical protein